MTPGLIQNTLQGQAETVQPGTEAAQAPVPVGKPPAMTNVPGLPPTGLDMQMSTLNQEYEQAQQRTAMGAGLVGGAVGGVQQPPAGQEPRTTGGPLTVEGGAPGPRPAPPAQGADNYAQSSLRDLAEKMARGYGLDFSRGTLVDPTGNFLQTPDQLAAGQADGDVGDTAASMNYIAQAINDQRIRMQGDKAQAALQAGAGLLAKRGRGSLAALQSNFYQNMAAVYTDPNLLPEQQDFSFWIQKEQLDEAEAIRGLESQDLGLAEGGGGGLGASAGSGSWVDSSGAGGSGRGDVVTTGPHAGQVPVYTYDPIAKTTRTTWESA